MRPIRKLALLNPYGRLDPKKPFAPFGNQPSRGSTFFVGCPAFHRPEVKKVRIGIAWQNLPPSFHLADHYAGYPGPITASSFKVAATFLTGGQWQPLDLVDNCLFNQATPLGLGTQFDLTLPERVPAPPRPRVEIGAFAYDPNTFDGFVRFELIEPEFGFGVGVYTKLVVDTTVANARAQIEMALPAPLFSNPPLTLQPLPNVPFTPLATGVSVLVAP
jgi:hypothetical protein